MRYEERFSLSPAGWDALSRLAALAQEKDVFLICQCGLAQRCHADLLLLSARERFGADIPTPRLRYPVYLSRAAAQNIQE